MDAVCARFLPLLLIVCHFHVHLDLVTPVPQGAHWLIRKQVHQADQAWLPSLMRSFVGYGSIREPYPPALRDR